MLLIRNMIDRPNIYLARRQISNQSTFADLDFIMPNYACDIKLIPKTMIFVDSRPAVCILTDYLLFRLVVAWGRSAEGNPASRDRDRDSDRPPEDVVADYSTILSEERRVEVLEKFRLGTCRVIVCTDAAGMGIDIRDVQRVIQWKVTSILNLSSYFQRAGRAGRDPSCKSVAILFHQASLSQLENEYELFRQDIEGPNGIEILKKIRGFDRGMDDGVSARRGKSSLKNVLLNRGIETVANDISASSSDPRKLICRGLLTQIGTSGCMRSCFLRYFDFASSNLPPDRCCDSCLEKSGLELPDSISSLLPEYTAKDPEDDDNRSNDTEDEDDDDPPNFENDARQELNPSKGPNSSSGRVPRMLALNPTQIDAFQNALWGFRKQIWQSEIGSPKHHELSPFRDTIFLTDKEVSRLSLKGHRVLEPEDIAKQLNQNKNFRWTLIAPFIKDLLQCLQETYRQNPPPAPPPKSNRNIVAVSNLTDKEERKRQLKREANQRYYAKQRAMKLEAAQASQATNNVIGSHNSILPLRNPTLSGPTAASSDRSTASGTRPPACGVPITACGAPSSTASGSNVSASGSLNPASGTYVSASGSPHTANRIPLSACNFNLCNTNSTETSPSFPPPVNTTSTNSSPNNTALQDITKAMNLPPPQESPVRRRKNPPPPLDQENVAKRQRIF